MTILDLSVLDKPLQEDAYEYIRDNNPQFLEYIQAALKDGFTPNQIFEHYMRNGGPHRYAFWLRVKHAAEYMTTEGE